MKKILTIAAVLLFAGTAFSQGKLLQWDQLMDRNLYPQREMMSFIFAPDGKTVTYYKGGEDKGFYGFDGKRSSSSPKPSRIGASPRTTTLNLRSVSN